MTNRIPAHALDPAGGAAGQAPVIDPTGMFVEWSDVTAGSSGVTGVGTVPHDFAKRSSGNITVSSTTWVDVDNALDLTVDAASGDSLLVVVNGLWNAEATEGHLNAATVVAGSPVNLIEPTSTTGVGGWWGRSGLVANIGAGFTYTVQAGDVASGQVTLRLRARQVGGNKILFADSTHALQWSVLNLSRVGQAAAGGGDIDGGTWDSTYLDVIDGGSF